MGDDNSKSYLLPISGVLIILAALGVTMFVQPFKGTRPFVPELRESYEKVNARLWQDPFRAVLDSVRDGKEPKSSGQFDIRGKAENKKEWRRLESLTSKTGKKKPVIVLGVMVPGAPYAEDTEIRMRLRYAVLSGLSRVGFTPEDPEHIGFIQVDSSTNITLSNIMPFEWLTHMEKEMNPVLVFWINDNVFEKSPLSYLSNLSEYLDIPKGVSEGRVRFKIIGPATSTTLKEMVREVFDPDISKGLGALRDSKIYSAMATVDNRLLLRDGAGEQPSEGHDLKGIENLSERESLRKIEDRFKSNHITLIRTIGFDKELAAKLVEELGNRKVGLKDEKGSIFSKKAHLVLVAEWDTYYGRSFRYALEEAIKENGVPPKGIDRRVHRISYLRGIDGSLPGEKEDKTDEKTEAKSDPLKNPKNLEQPIGKSQYDYLRRLAEETYHLDQGLQASGGEIKAIGVMGTDFYDKYLVLQALRQRFPDVVFFTTDLDARFLHPDNFKWTRNLIVASNFGLSLRKDPAVDDQGDPSLKPDPSDSKRERFVDIQGEAPPFRDNYQTSVFWTVLRAFSDGPDRVQNDNDQRVKQLIKEWNGKELQPLIFEIGRRQAIVLTDTRGTIHPGNPQVKGGVKFYIQTAGGMLRIAGIIASALIFLFLTSARVNSCLRSLAGAGKRYQAMAVIAILLFIVFGVAVYLISNQPDEEPFSVFEGISVWPTEIFRFIAILLSVLFIYWSWSSRKENRKAIDKEFFNSSSREDSKTGEGRAALNWIRNVKRFDSILNGAEIDQEPGGGKEEAPLKVLWDEYTRRDSESFWRVAVISFFYILFCVLIVTLDIPVSPVRGTITPVVDIVLVAVSVISFVALLSYVFDVTRSCRKFIVAVAEECSRKSHDQARVPVQKQIDNQLTLIRLIARRTDTVGKFIFYPFIVWLVMFVSRFDYFDNWRTPLGLAAVISLGALYAWTSAFLLRRSAEGARSCAVGRLKTTLFDILKEEKPNPDRIRQIESVLDEIGSIRQGAFAPFTQHPLVQSLLVPFGGVGGIYLIEFFTKMNI
jgi:hypothetical protein